MYLQKVFCNEGVTLITPMFSSPNGPGWLTLSGRGLILHGWRVHTEEKTRKRIKSSNIVIVNLKSIVLRNGQQTMTSLQLSFVVLEIIILTRCLP